MIYLTQLIHVREGCEADFQQFEEIVLPRLSRYSGELLLRLRPDQASKIAGSGELPYEVHIVRFETEEGLARYSNDEERQRWLHLKEPGLVDVRTRARQRFLRIAGEFLHRLHEWLEDAASIWDARRQSKMMPSGEFVTFY